MRNQVGAIVGALVYIFVLETLIGGCIALGALDDVMPKYGLGGVSNALAGADPTTQRRCSARSPAGLLLAALRARSSWSPGSLLMQRRDVTA